MNGSSSSVSKSKKKSKGTAVDTVDGPSAIKEAIDFSIEYAKSSRAKCRHCEEKIEKVNELWMNYLIQEDFLSKLVFKSNIPII